MRSRNNPETTENAQEQLDFDSDRHPTPRKALHRVANEGVIPDAPVEWIEVNCLASGELTYRWRTPRADEAEGGYLGPS